MRELSVDLLEDFKVEGLPDSMAATSKAQVTAKIRCFLREAYRRSWTEFALAEKVRPYRATHEQKNPYTDAEVDLILAGAEKLKGGRDGYASAPLTFRLLLELMLETGIRVSDAIRFERFKRLHSPIKIRESLPPDPSSCLASAALFLMIGCGHTTSLIGRAAKVVPRRTPKLC
jgi:site-specific recombinase XerD